jgi:hypothetical protein
VTAPREVLDAHTTLYERLKYPPPLLTDFYASFFSEKAIRSMEKPDGGELLSRWLQMLAPARDERDFLSMVGRPLYGAPTYQVTGTIVDAVTATYEASAGKGIWLQEGEVPTETGFAWLDEPVVLTDAGGFSIATRALSWSPQTIPEEFLQGEWPQRGSRRGLRLTSYSHVDDTDSISVPEMADRMRAIGMPLSISHSSYISYGTQFQARRLSEEVTSDDIIHWAHTLWMFMGTEIVTTARPQVERPARRRAQRSVGVSEVNVVTLRRVRHGDTELAHKDIDWSCRWIVQAHPRHVGSYAGIADPHHAKVSGPGQPCQVCGLPTTHVRAYVKGPDGMPLKAVPETVYRVAR